MRYPSVSGAFYSSNKEELRSDVEGYIKMVEGEKFKMVFGLVSPHAGYMYSGWVAGHSYASLKGIPEWVTFVLIGPNHTGRGKAVAISRDDWMTPLGVVRNDREIGDLIKKNSKIAEFDEEAHLFEHSIEVQLPFLQTIIKEPKVVEICMSSQGYDFAKDLGEAIYAACKDSGKSAIVIASSDFTHYESAEVAKKNDEKALSLIEQLKTEEFIDLVELGDLSICGYGPIATAMMFANKNEAKGKILKYATSGEITKDYSAVVGYGSVVFYK